MSLDVCLEIVPFGTGIFIRENDSMREIMNDEWNEKFPGCEPIIFQAGRETSNTVYESNITHNLNKMAEAAGIYEHLWRPDEIGITKASQLIEHLELGLIALVASPEKFKEYNPPNGWGDYHGLVNFVRSYLQACKEYPDAIVTVSR